ncbi:MAG: type II toxin-antitoxin system Phd/YefM family antitoxin [Tepidiformaceae bacterium]
MPRTVNVHEAKTHLSRLLEDVRAGEEIILAKNGHPCARLIPLADSAPEPIPLGFVEGYFSESFFESLPDGELSAWEGAVEPA